jgi:hypothetical protein
VQGNGQRFHFSRRSGGFHTAAIDRGLILHEALANIHTLADIGLAVMNIARRWELDKGEILWLKKSVEDVVTSPKLSHFFDPAWLCRPELEMRDKSGKIQRADRVCFRNGKAWVAEFKTGEARPEHTSQVLSYARLLEDAGKEIEECFLVYVSEEVDIRNCPYPTQQD